MSNCIFCQIINKELPADRVFEDEQVLVIFDIDDVVKGHLLVIFKPHRLNVSDLSEDEYLHFSSIVYQTEKHLLPLVQKKRAVLAKTGGIISHFHFHLFPVDLDTSWEELKNIFEKKVRYQYQTGEREQLLAELKQAFVQ